DLDVCVRTGYDLVADLQAFRSDNITLLAVHVVDQGDVRRTVRIVLDRRDVADDAVLIPLEVDDAVFTLMSAAMVANRNFTLVIAAGFLEERRKQRFLRLACRDLFERRDRHSTAGRGSRFVLLDWHLFSLLAV